MKLVRGSYLFAILGSGLFLSLLAWVLGWYIWEALEWGYPGGIFLSVTSFHNLLGVLSSAIAIGVFSIVIKLGARFIRDRGDSEPILQDDLDSIKENFTKTKEDLKIRVLNLESHLGDIKKGLELKPPEETIYDLEREKIVTEVLEKIDTKSAKADSPGALKVQQKNEEKNKIDTKEAKPESVKIE